MRRVVLRAVLCLVLFTVSAADGFACGDKYLSVGRGGRYQRGYISLHPVKILVLKSKTTGRQNFLSRLKIAGHRLTVTNDVAKLKEMLTAGRYDVVLADYAHASLIESVLGSDETGPMFLPVVEEASSLSQADVKKYSCVLNAQAGKKQKNFLAALDEAVETRLKALPVACDSAL